MLAKYRFSVIMNIALIAIIAVFIIGSQTAAAEEESADVGGATVSLVVPDDYESCDPSDIIQTTGVPEDWTIQAYYEFRDPVTNDQISDRVNVTVSGNLALQVNYPPVADWPEMADGSKAIVVGTGAIISSPAGERAILTLKWKVTCPPAVPTNTPVPPTETPEPPPTNTPPPGVTPTKTVVPPTETPVPPTPTATTPPPTPTAPAGGQGCTPGYWKQQHHFDSWVNYLPTDDYETTFGVTASFNKDLVGALSQGGGGERALGRHATAALLNSVNPDVDYAYTEASVILLVQNAYASGDFEGLKNAFESQNDSVCPLN